MIVFIRLITSIISVVTLHAVASWYIKNNVENACDEKKKQQFLRLTVLVMESKYNRGFRARLIHQRN